MRVALVVIRDGVVHIEGAPDDLTAAEARAIGRVLAARARDIAQARREAREKELGVWRHGAAGGVARASKLTPERRQEIARRAARARWG